MPTTDKPQQTTHEGYRRARPAARRSNIFAELYRSALGKKYLMAISGLVLMAYVFVHMIGNLKLYQGEGSFNSYAEWLREIGSPAVPDEAALWAVRVILVAAFVIHIVAAAQLTAMNRRAAARGGYAERDWVASDFASRTMRWSGVIVGLFVLYHLADLTFGWANPNPDFAYGGNVYENVLASFRNPLAAGIYVVANLVLAVHLYHGAWSLFQSMGWNNPRYNHWRRYFAVGFAVVVAAGNLSFPIGAMIGVIS